MQLAEMMQARSDVLDLAALNQGASSKPGTSPPPSDTSLSAHCGKDIESVDASLKKPFTPGQSEPHHGVSRSLPSDEEREFAPKHKVTASEQAPTRNGKADPGTPLVAKPGQPLVPLEEAVWKQPRVQKSRVTSLDPPMKLYNYFEKSGLQQDKESGAQYAQQLSKKTAESIIASFKAMNTEQKL